MDANARCIAYSKIVANQSAELAAVREELERVSYESGLVHRYVSQLFLSLAPQCELSSDTMSITSQLDNAICGLTKERDALREELEKSKINAAELFDACKADQRAYMAATKRAQDERDRAVREVEVAKGLLKEARDRFVPVCDAKGLEQRIDAFLAGGAGGEGT